MQSGCGITSFDGLKNIEVRGRVNVRAITSDRVDGKVQKYLEHVRV